MFVTAGELAGMLERGEPVTVLDVRWSLPEPDGSAAPSSSGGGGEGPGLGSAHLVGEQAPSEPLRQRSGQAWWAGEPDRPLGHLGVPAVHAAEDARERRRGARDDDVGVVARVLHAHGHLAAVEQDGNLALMFATREEGPLFAITKEDLRRADKVKSGLNTVVEVVAKDGDGELTMCFVGPRGRMRDPQRAKREARSAAAQGRCRHKEEGADAVASAPSCCSDQIASMTAFSVDDGRIAAATSAVSGR